MFSLKGWMCSLEDTWYTFPASTSQAEKRETLVSGALKQLKNILANGRESC